MDDIHPDIKIIRLLLSRLEHISADSYWAHRASGVRGSLLKISEDIEKIIPVQQSAIKLLLDLGFSILEKAGRVLRK